MKTWISSYIKAASFLLMLFVVCSTESAVISEASQPDLGIAQEAKKEASQLWHALKAMRYDKEFIRLGYSMRGKGGKWEKRRASLNTKWNTYLDTLPEAKKFENELIGAIHNMKSIGRDWWNNNGQDTKSSLDLSKDVERILSEHKIEAKEPDLGRSKEKSDK